MFEIFNGKTNSKWANKPTADIHIEGECSKNVESPNENTTESGGNGIIILYAPSNFLPSNEYEDNCLYKDEELTQLVTASELETALLAGCIAVKVAGKCGYYYPHRVSSYLPFWIKLYFIGFTTGSTTGVKTVHEGSVYVQQ